MNENQRKIAFVTGASRGIGAIIAKILARDGFDIWLNYRSNNQEAQKVKTEIEKIGRQCLLLKFDVADYKQTEEALSTLLETQTPYVVVNNAGFRRDTLLVWMKESEWKDVISVTLDGFFNITKNVLPFMLKNREGRIINITSAAAHFAIAGQSNYSAAKAGLVGATKSLAAEVAKRNILVNAVSPGFIETEMLEGLPINQIIKTIPLGKLGKSEDVAEIVSFLASNKAEYITGQVFHVNGGIGG
ncbi:3-oxoacyl-ACP reductase FabG [Endomicrobium proavitum]|uniref:3-oxoacyl-[acyl-carrier-protein] reductase FabG n=1 Tax=Endomicrobium proavitum TaxID=1408281 RepID=A0A0G3WKA2_9BACT|nr:3-oxoacyl-ACP reductase FabG [Endomicrobium proavitum]AKL98330.1 3-oxoacyl-[acyl-carrier-protein] reductase FabG [Endomicrobium proavitum]